MKSNYISINRKILDWRWYKRPNTFRVFLHILIKANYKDKEWENISIKRGSFITSHEKLMTELNLSKAKIRTALKHLIQTKEISVLAHTKYTLITVNKYDSYQFVNDNSTQTTHKQQSNNNQITTTNNINNINKENNTIAGIEIIYKTCVQDQMWIEQLCMSNGMSIKQVVEQMKKFTTWLKDKDEKNVNQMRFKSGFAGFIRKSKDYGKKNRHDDLIL
ncbi:MAG: hypothetical protein L7V85_07050 [Bacteroidia bacterium]|nr:hypothetical protein [Bacteroidia bacterium]